MGAAGPLRLVVAVCTNRRAEEIRPCLEALASRLGDGVDRGLVVSSGDGGEAHAGRVRLAESFGLEIEREAAPGLSRARNRALAAAGDATVIAYVDDDAVVAEDWPARLRNAWSRAEPSVGCIGGAIVPRWLSPPPRWLTEGLYPALSLLDLGPGVRDLDVEAGEDVWGANVSYRVHELREAGGFDPAYGGFPGVPLFGDESAVHRRMAARGLVVRYDGSVRVEHLVDPARLRLRGMLRRRFWSGVLMPRPPAPRRPVAALLGLRALAGSAVAAVGGRRGLAVERLARASALEGTAVSPAARRWLRLRYGWPGR